MTHKPPRWLVQLREQAPAFLDALERSTAMSTFAHLLRSAVDTRPENKRIEAVIRETVGALESLPASHEIVGVVERRIASKLRTFPLSDVPSRPTVCKYLYAMAREKNAKLPVTFHRPRKTRVMNSVTSST